MDLRDELAPDEEWTPDQVAQATLNELRDLAATIIEITEEAIRADEREKNAQAIEAVANEVFPSDSTEFFLHAEAARAHNRRTREGMLRAAEVVRGRKP